MDANQVERVAEALCAADNDGSDPPYTEGDWRDLSEVARNCYRRMARWHLAALAVERAAVVEECARAVEERAIRGSIATCSRESTLSPEAMGALLSAAAALRSLSPKPATDSKEPPRAL